MKPAITTLPVAEVAGLDIGSDTPRALLTQVIDQLRPHLARAIPPKNRLFTFWSFVMESRDLGASDVVEEDFRGVARECGLIADLGRNGAEDVEHILQWGLRGCNPFENEALQ